jgi:hypothetical protein
VDRRDSCSRCSHLDLLLEGHGCHRGRHRGYGVDLCYCFGRRARCDCCCYPRVRMLQQLVTAEHQRLVVARSSRLELLQPHQGVELSTPQHQQ